MATIVHLKDAPCGIDTKDGYRYTVHEKDVTCKKCLNPAKESIKRPSKGKEKAELQEKK